MTDELNQAIGNRIRKRREAMGLTQSDVGDHLGLTKNAVGKIESGYSALTLKNLFALPLVLHRPIEYFLGLDTALTENEQEMLPYFRELPAELRLLALDRASRWKEEFPQLLEVMDPGFAQQLREQMGPYKIKPKKRP